MAETKKKTKKKSSNPSLDYRKELEKELARLKKFVTSTEGMSKEDIKFYTAKDLQAWKAQDKNPGKLSVINYGRWSGPQGWRQKAGSLTGRIELLEKEIGRVDKYLGSRYREWGDFIPVGKDAYNKKGELKIPNEFKPDSNLTINGRKRMVNPDYVAGLDPIVQADKAAKLEGIQNDEVDALIDSYGGTGKNRLKRHEALQILSSAGRETTFEPGKVPVTKTKTKEQKEKAPAPLGTDIFTLDPRTGEAVGVLTRNQRKAFEARADVQEALKISKTPTRSYKNKDQLYVAGG